MAYQSSDSKVKELSKRLANATSKIDTLEHNFLIATTPKRTVEEKDMFIANIKRKEAENRAKRLAHIKFLDTLKKEIDGKCTCGQHVGINFVDTDGVVVESGVCPRIWWIHQSYLAFSEGRLKEFTETTPLEKYLNFGVKKRGRK